MSETDRYSGTIVTDYERWAIAMLERGLSPCEVWLDDQGREVNE